MVCALLDGHEQTHKTVGIRPNLNASALIPDNGDKLCFRPLDYAAQFREESLALRPVVKEREIARTLPNLAFVQYDRLTIPVSQLELEECRDKSTGVGFGLKHAGQDHKNGVFRVGNRLSVVAAFVDIDEWHPLSVPHKPTYSILPP